MTPPADRRWRATRPGDMPLEFTTTTDHPTLNGERVLGTNTPAMGMAWSLANMTIEAAIEVCKRNGWKVEELRPACPHCGEPLRGRTTCLCMEERD